MISCHVGQELLSRVEFLESDADKRSAHAPQQVEANRAAPLTHRLVPTTVMHHRLPKPPAVTSLQVGVVLKQQEHHVPMALNGGDVKRREVIDAPNVHCSAMLNQHMRGVRQA